MKITQIYALTACALGLAACSTSLPSFDFFSSKPTSTTLTIESDPPGADAKLSIGGGCRTPCTQTVALASDFTVSYSLNGYQPQTVTVHPNPNADTSSGGALLDPNPAFAQMQPAAAPPPKPTAKKRKPRPAQPAAAATPTQGMAPQAATPQTMSPNQGGFAPPTGTFTPTR